MTSNSPDGIEAVSITPLTEYESVQAAAVFHKFLKQEDPYALTRTIEHILKMRRQDHDIEHDGRTCPCYQRGLKDATPA